METYENFRSEDGYFYVIYKTINLVNDMFYIGQHKTRNLDDDYFGSGLKISFALRKYGKENFKKEYLFFLSSYEDLLKKEKEIVNEDLISRDDCYNIVLGGSSSWSKLANISKWKKMRSDKDYFDYVISKISDTNKIKYSVKENHPWFNRKHTDETISKMKKTHSLKENHKGEKNSQFGTCWIYNDKESIKIKKDELAKFLANGWLKGRRIKFSSQLK